METIINPIKLIRTLLVLFLAIGMMGCQKEESRSRIGGARGARTTGDGRLTTTTGTVSQQSASGFTGIIWSGTGISQQEFQYRVDNFMSVSFDPIQNIGAVSGSYQADTGLRFMALNRAEMSSGQPVLTNANGSLRPQSGSIRILVWDEIAKTTGQGFQPTFEMVSGQIQNNQVTLSFSDSLGTLTIYGYINNGYFQGVIDYDNRQYWDGETPGAA
ncbi:MAG: hypothetical protein KDD61_18400, partial [Bdellovibrionales bacterium]|nr:hypothetical protein [Bdellovibrionales bacterium]